MYCQFEDTVINFGLDQNSNYHLSFICRQFRQLLLRTKLNAYLNWNFFKFYSVIF